MNIYQWLAMFCTFLMISTIFYFKVEQFKAYIIFVILCGICSLFLFIADLKSRQMPKPENNDKVQLKPEAELLQIMRNKNWNGNDENRQEIAKEFGGKIVVAKNPQDHHNYFFTEEGPSFDYSMIDSIKSK